MEIILPYTCIYMYSEISEVCPKGPWFSSATSALVAGLVPWKPVQYAKTVNIAVDIHLFR